MLEKVTVLSDCKVLVPNKEHKNFTETKEVIKKGKVLNGRFVNIDGKRRGQERDLCRAFAASSAPYDPVFQHLVDLDHPAGQPH